MTYKIKRLRKTYDGRESWVTIGTCVISDDKKSGSIYMASHDETWRLYPVAQGENTRGESKPNTTP